MIYPRPQGQQQQSWAHRTLRQANSRPHMSPECVCPAGNSLPREELPPEPAVDSQVDLQTGEQEEKGRKACFFPILADFIDTQPSDNLQ